MKILTYSPAFTRSNWFLQLEQIVTDIDIYLVILAMACIFMAAMFQK